ncbi:MAG: peptidase M22 [Ruminococcaceae bacterium]|nr:peptidase M22 [Oscillospiraceae bacterium]
MKYYLGVDTSNYTTSLALCDEEGRIIKNCKKLLPVKQGEKGLRQSDAVFAHTVNLPIVAKELGTADITAVGYSAYPRDIEGSYMPCFLCGKAYAESLAALLDIPVYGFSHQRGHIRAALYSAGAEELLGKEYLAFHVSGGTTEILHVKDGAIELIGGSRDLTAGQAIDRVGVMLGFSFPCGAELENECKRVTSPIKPKISVKGLECHFSGLENLAKKLWVEGGANGTRKKVAAYTIEFVLMTLDKMTENLTALYPGLPIVYSGGVMSNKKIKKHFTDKYNAYFAAPEFSSDNAAGTALLCLDKYKRDVL